jgi:membrane-bound lytic murein transglycosylase D
MLKRKFVTAGFFGNGLLLLMVFNGTLATTAHSPHQALTDSAILQLQAFDSSVLDLNIPDSQWANAPKIQMNRHVVSYVKDYTRKNSEELHDVRDISNPYFAIIDSVFTHYNLPVELKYLAVIESKLNPKAVSHAGAVGPWQLMASTARLLSLKVKGRVDERTHYYKSTVAAAKYLKDLYHEFNDWLLVIAAYNVGPARVHYAMKMSGSKNFWYLQSYLPAETRGHVKRFIATHYYFEGHGSITTLTQSEVLSFKKTVTAFVEEKKLEFTNDLNAKTLAEKDMISKAGKDNARTLAAADVKFK